LASSFLVRATGLEPIAEELSGGQFLPPVQTLAATLIFCQRQKMQIKSCRKIGKEALASSFLN